MHHLLTNIQSALVPLLGCNCAGGQRPDSAHPFPEGELWKLKTAAIPPILCSYPPMFLSPSLWLVTRQWQCIKGNCRTMQEASQEFEEPFFKKKTRISYGRLLSYSGRTISAAAGTTKHPNKALIFNCNSECRLVKQQMGEKFLIVFSVCNLEIQNQLGTFLSGMYVFSLCLCGLNPQSRNMHTLDCRL